MSDPSRTAAVSVHLNVRLGNTAPVAPALRRLRVVRYIERNSGRPATKSLLVKDSLERGLARQADVVVPAQRGRSEQGDEEKGPRNRAE